MQIIYVKQRDQTLLDILSTNLSGHNYSLRKIDYPHTLYSIEIQPEIAESQLTLLRRVLHSYSVDEQRVRDWLGY